MRTRPHTPRTGRRKSLKVAKSKKRKLLGKRSPRQLAAATGKRNKRKGGKK